MKLFVEYEKLMPGLDDGDSNIRLKIMVLLSIEFVTFPINFTFY